MWEIRIERAAFKTLSKLPKSDQRRILDFLEGRLASRESPRELGEALTGPLAGLWKYRIGAYRILASIDDHAVTILVLRIGNRRDVYR